MRGTYPFSLLGINGIQIRDSECGGDDRRRGARDSVLRERSVVRPAVPCQKAPEVMPDLFRQVCPGDRSAPELELVACVRRRKMHKLVGEFIMVLQGVHKRGLID